jgi:RNA polymerase primary sigma factor/RNA polymerase nonessential primary-like sigma factor
MSSAPGRARADQRDADLVGQYLAEVGATPLLTAAEEVDLSRRIEAGVYAAELLRAGADAVPPAELRAVAADGLRAKDHMIRANLRLVVSFARKHAHRGLSFLDVVQEGNLGLIRAVEKFDHAKGYKFSTYAVWWIRQAIERGIAEQSRTVRLPQNVVEEVSKLNRVERRLRTELDREPTLAEVAAAAGLPQARVTELHDVSRAAISLETPVGDDGNGAAVGDLIEDTDAVQPAEWVEHESVAAGLRAAVGTLPPRQALILTRRYGLTDGRSRTLQEVADELGLTRERIRQLEKESLRTLRDTELLALTA